MKTKGGFTKNKQAMNRTKKNVEIDSKLENASLEDFDLSKARVYSPNPKFKTTIPTSIRLPQYDIELVKMIGHIKGVKYQTLLKMYIHEGIKQDRNLLVQVYR
ncbi:MAG: hypothetical protein QMD92_08255 [bacterium]|nr:hypothetical protein [bacterium]